MGPGIIIPKSPRSQCEAMSENQGVLSLQVMFVHVEMFLVCHNWGRRDAAKHPVLHRTAPPSMTQPRMSGVPTLRNPWSLNVFGDEWSQHHLGAY